MLFKNKLKNLYFLAVASLAVLVLGQNCSTRTTLNRKVTDTGSMSQDGLAIELVEKPAFYSNSTNASFKYNLKTETALPESVEVFFRHGEETEWIRAEDVIQLVNLNEGTHSLEVKAIHANGLESSPTIYQWIVDLSKPTVQFNLAPPAILGRTSFDSQFSVFDSATEVMEVHCQVDSIEINNCSQTIPLINLAEGPHLLSVWAVDKAGNTSDVMTSNFVVDTRSPWIELTQHPSPFESSGNATFAFKGQNSTIPFSSFDCQLDDGKIHTCSSPLSLTNLAEGRHSFKIRGQHQNSEIYPMIEISWTIDNTPPSLTILSPASNATVSIDQLNFVFQGNDESGSGIKEYQCLVSPNIEFESCQSPKTYLHNKLTAGQSLFKVRAIDYAGLSSEASIQFTLIEWNAPFITVNLQGGAALAGNIIPLDANKNLLRSYSKLGMGLPGNFATIQSMGAAWYIDSGLLKGIKSIITENESLKIRVFAIANQSKSDTTSNKLDVSGLIAMSGLKGTYFHNVGTSNTTTGIGHDFAITAPALPFILSNSSEYIAKLPASTNPNPLADSSIASTWALTNNTSPSSINMTFAAATLNALNHNSGTVGLTLGGYDYHNGTRATGDAKDFQAGELLGRIIKTALIKNQKTFIYLTTDGGIVSADSDQPGSPWIADRNEAALQVFFVVDPTNSYTYDHYFIGAFTAEQIVDPNSVAGIDTEKAAAIVACNYLAFNDQRGLCPTLVGNKLSAQEIEKTTVVKPQVSTF
jgi:hypothetical protein